MRDRYGEEIENAETGAHVLPELQHDQRCVDGWINRDSVPAVPCLQCKPHLTRVVRRRHGRSPPTRA